MNQSDSIESGYLGREEAECYVGSAMRDVEILRITGTNVIARGRRYGRLWFIKGLRPEMRHSTTMRRQLQKEFEIHSRLRHPNIVQAVGFEEIEGLGTCIIQEWIEGDTLEAALHSGSLPDKTRTRLLKQLVDAVAYLHRCGVVHRDIKPANVMIRKTGEEAVLVDFGLADSDDYVEIKAPGGTPGFISPEQSAAGGVNPADDVYSLGMVLNAVASPYRKIAAKCTGPLSSRMPDAGELLKAMERRDRRPKTIATTIILIILIAGAAAGILRIISLGHEASWSRHQFTILNEKNTGNENLVANLRDSLAQIREKLASTQAELTLATNHEILRQELLQECYNKIDAELQHYDRDVFSRIAEGDIQAFNEALLKLVADLTAIIDNYIPTIRSHPSLTGRDADQLKMNLYNYQAVALSKYQKKWQNRIIP